jgi:hypothetical protein
MWAISSDHCSAIQFEPDGQVPYEDGRLPLQRCVGGVENQGGPGLEETNRDPLTVVDVALGKFDLPACSGYRSLCPNLIKLIVLS